MHREGGPTWCLPMAKRPKRKLASGASLVYVSALAEHTAPFATGIYSGDEKRDVAKDDDERK